MNKRFPLYALLYFALIPAPAAAPAGVFRFHSSQEPLSVDPLTLTEATGGFMFYNLYRGLYRVAGDGRLVPELASSCVWADGAKMSMTCRLRPGIRFSDGSPIKAEHFLNSWRRLVSPRSGSRHAELLAGIHGFEHVVGGNAKAAAIGVTAKGERVLEIRLRRPDPELLYKLASPILTPLLDEPPSNPERFAAAVTTGPYRIKGWARASRIELEPNPHYFATGNRPPVEILLVDEDATALRMFDLGKLSLLRRLTVKEIGPRKDKPGFLFIPTFRFDYVGFGPQLLAHPELRKALALSLNYAELTKAYQTPGKIGCPSLPRRLADPYPCHEFDLNKAKAAFANVSDGAKKRTWELAFSKAGGEDVARGMEWMQAQWKKHLGLNIELRVMENAAYLRRLTADPPALFRKGLNLDRPTCTAALENFTSGSPENLIRYDSPAFNDLVGRMGEAADGNQKASLCGKALAQLMAEHRLIPLGELYFAMLAGSDFEGWKISPLNQLDLTMLRAKAPPK